MEIVPLSFQAILHSPKRDPEGAEHSALSFLFLRLYTPPKLGFSRLGNKVLNNKCATQSRQTERRSTKCTTRKRPEKTWKLPSKLKFKR